MRCSNIVAYTVNRDSPLPYRLKSSTFRMQVPNLASIMPDINFIRTIRESAVWRNMEKFLFTVRTWATTAIWGDRLFLRFSGPVTILLQSRPFRTSDIFTSRDIDEMADSPAGATNLSSNGAEKEGPKQQSTVPVASKVA